MVRNRKLCVDGGLSAGHITSTLTIISTVLCLCSWGCTHSKELRWKSACADEILFLDCNNSSIIAIHEASFSSDFAHAQNTSSCFTSDGEQRTNGTCQEDIRVAVNRGCSGVGNCNFSYSLHPGKRCDGGSGVVTIWYDCVKESSINRYCNDKIRSKEGYIASPGYPHFYPPLTKCQWKLQAADGQTVIFRLLDIHMRMPVERNGSSHCVDAFAIFEGNTRLMMECGNEVEILQTLEAEVDEDLVVQFTSQSFHPASGFLLYFKVQGCSTLPPPEDGYLVHRNGSSATYVCCQRYVFNDTQENSRTLQCIADQYWNNTLAPCVAVEELKQIKVNHSLDLELESDNITLDEPSPSLLSSEASYMEDILVPSVLMAALLLGNAFIVAVILRIRRKQKSKYELEDDDLTPERPVPEATNV